MKLVHIILWHELFETKYSRMDQVKLVEDPSNFFKAVHTMYLVHS